MGLTKPIDISGLATKADIEAISGSGGVVKHIQRGTVTGMGSNTLSVTLTGFTNLDKMSVRLYAGTATKSDYGVAHNPAYVKSLSLTKLEIFTYDITWQQAFSGTEQISTEFSYEVIEYY